MSTSNYQKMFNNPIYYGLMNFDGEIHEGKHEPIISKRLFDQAQEVMRQKSKPKTPQLKPYLYRGLFRCGECGCFITTETQKGHNYLHCTKRVTACTQKYVREESIATQVDRSIERVALEAAIADEIVRQLEKDREATAKAQEGAILRCKDDITTCEKQIDLLLDMRLNEQIGESEYVSKKHVLVNQKAELKGKLEAFERNRQNRFEPAIRFILEAKDATILLSTGKPEQKRDYLKKIGSNFQLADKSLAVEFKNPWNLLAEFNSDLTTTNTRLREFSKKSEWRREGDSNPRYDSPHHLCVFIGKLASKNLLDTGIRCYYCCYCYGVTPQTSTISVLLCVLHPLRRAAHATLHRHRRQAQGHVHRPQIRGRRPRSRRRTICRITRAQGYCRYLYARQYRSFAKFQHPRFF